MRKDQELKETEKLQKASFVFDERDWETDNWLDRVRIFEQMRLS